jgi:acyl-CoA synthetase (AMP-forming)/AMP-acid ligase II
LAVVTDAAMRAVRDHIGFQARLSPHALAVYGPAGAVSFQALATEIDGLATDLLAHGLTRRDIVGLHLDSSYLHLLAILALDRLSIPSMSFTPAAASAAPTHLPPQYGVTAIVSAHAAPASPPCRWIAIPEPQRPRIGAPDPARLATLDDPADALLRLSWSSATTGGTKGAPLSRRLQMHRMAWRRLLRGFGPQTRYLTAMPLGAAPCYGSIIAVLAAGGAVILPSPTVGFVEWANALRVTVTSAPPALLADLVGRSERLHTMEYLEVLGAHLPGALAREARSALTPNIWIVYGTTETDRVAHADAAVCIADPHAVGHVTPGVEAEVVDAADRPLAAGREGHLRIRGAQVIAGYHNDEAATRTNFRDGWFYPGDIAAITQDGMLRITGRIEEVIARGAETLSPLPIEEAMRGLPGVRDVAVFGLAGADDVQQICAAVVLDPGAEAARVRAAAVERLGDRAPRRLLVMDRLPRNPNGKVLRRELVALARQHRPG